MRWELSELKRLELSMEKKCCTVKFILLKVKHLVHSNIIIFYPNENRRPANEIFLIQNKLFTPVTIFFMFYN